MLTVALASLTAGIICGFFINPDMARYADTVLSIALYLLVFSVGIDLGSNKDVFKGIKQWGFKIVLIPITTALASLAGGIAAGIIMGYTVRESGAVAAGFGWYSLSAVIIRDMAGAQLGTVAFLANVFREILAFMLIPIVARLDELTAVAPGGATAMDTTLPMVSRYAGKEAAIFSVVSGVLLTLAVPVLVPLIINWV